MAQAACELVHAAAEDNGAQHCAGKEVVGAAGLDDNIKVALHRHNDTAKLADERAALCRVGGKGGGKNAIGKGEERQNGK